MNNNIEWNIMSVITEKKRVAKLHRDLDKMIRKAKIELYDNLSGYYHFDYQDYIPEEKFLKYMEMWKEVYDTCCLCGEGICNCLEERREENARKN